MSGISASAASAREAARQSNGEFGVQENAEVGDVVLTMERCARCDRYQPHRNGLCMAPERDVAWLSEHRGAFENGYDDEMAAHFAEGFDTVELAAVWEYYDESGFGGDSRFAVRAVDEDGARGDWHELSDGAWDYLSNPQSTVDPAQVDMCGEGWVGPMPDSEEMADIDSRYGYNVAYASEMGGCTVCGEPVDSRSEDLCDTHQGQAYEHESGEHDDYPHSNCFLCE